MSPEWILVLLVGGALYYVWDEQATTVLPATSSDWFIVVHPNGVDANVRTVSLAFYPVLGFRLRLGHCKPLTSRPYETDRHFDACQLLEVASCGDYGRWFRNGVQYDQRGEPTGYHFATIVARYREANFVVYPHNIPAEYVPFLEKSDDRLTPTAQ